MPTAPCAYCGADYPVHLAVCPACGALAVPTRTLPVGTTLQGGRLAVGRVLGEGGFGITYKGVHKPLQRIVAIKELFPENAQRQGSRVLVPQAQQLAYRQAVAATLQEARHIARLQAPGIVEVFDTFRENDTVYIVMEYLEGQTLLERIEEQGPLPPAAVRALALEICDALAVLHAQQLLHRDLKPENLLLTRDGRTVLIDFGAARPYQTDRTMRQTRVFTEAYAAPEQYSSQGRFGPYTDIFALGATLFHALTGALPPRAIDRLQDPNLVLQLPGDIDPEWDAALDQALRLSIQERPQTVAAFRQLLAGDDTGATAGRVLAPATGVPSLGVSSQHPALLASGGSDGTVRLWEVTSGQCRHSLKHEERVETVAFSPDGHTLASGGKDSTVRLWDVASGQCLHSLVGHGGEGVFTVAFSPDGHTLASGGKDSTVRLWDVASGQCLHSLVGHGGEGVFTVAFSLDGHTLASGSWFGEVRLWEVVSGQCRHSLGHEGWMWTVAFSPDGHTLASGGHFDGTVRLWDVASGQCRHTLVGHTGWVTDVTFSPDGHTLASGGGDGTVQLWDVASGQCRHTLGHEGGVWAVAFSPDGHTLASGGYDDGTVRLWDMASGQCRHSLGHEGGVWAVAFSPDGHTLASGGYDDGTARLWNVASGQCRHSLVGHGDSVPAVTVAFSPDGHTLASGGSDGTVRLWNAASGRCRHSLMGHGDSVPAVAFNPP